MEAMRQAAIATGSHDFKAFTSAKKGKKSTVRTVDSIQIDRVGDEIHFTFSEMAFYIIWYASLWYAPGSGNRGKKARRI